MQKRILLKVVVVVWVSQSISGVEKRECPHIPGLSNPVNIFHQYFKQTMKVFNPHEKNTQVTLLYYRVQRKKSHIHRFVFRLKNTYANRYEYVGIVSVVPKKERLSLRNRHYIIRYINSSDLLDTITLLGIYELKEQTGYPCNNMKKLWLDFLLKDPYIVTRTEVNTPGNCVTSDKLTKLFSLFFVSFQKILKSFGIEVSIGQLGFDPVILDILLEVYKDFPFIQVSTLVSPPDL
jgi:hypothetical protein